MSEAHPESWTEPQLSRLSRVMQEKARFSFDLDQLGDRTKGVANAKANKKKISSNEINHEQTL